MVTVGMMTVSRNISQQESKVINVIESSGKNEMQSHNKDKMK